MDESIIHKMIWLNVLLEDKCSRTLNYCLTRDVGWGLKASKALFDCDLCSLLSELLDLVPVMSPIVNASLSTGTVCKQFKQAVVIPLLKKIWT